jgi:hypothetical protein
MIVYRAATRLVRPEPWLAALRAEARRLAGSGGDHDAIRELLIETGALEAGVADALAPEADVHGPPQEALRAATCAAARALRASWDGASAARRRGALARVVAALDALAAHALPAVASVGVQEGYAFYALYPESYLEAARCLMQASAPAHAVCIGVRAIGASLAAAAVAGLETGRGTIHSYTVRPRGHPFDRHVALAPSLADALRAHADALFVVADEGPGLSGSSFASVSRALASLGIPDDRIVLFPSWMPSGAGFVSQGARERWQRHRKLVISFDALWVHSGRLARALGAPGADLVDVGAGRWRPLWLEAPRRYPPVHPQHERRKYLWVTRPWGARLRAAPSPAMRVAAGHAGARLLKFVGLGAPGRIARERAMRLAAAGFAPRARGAIHGFLIIELAPGAPLAAGVADPALVERLAQYLAFVAREFRTDAAPRMGELLHLVATNAADALGPQRAPTADALAALAAPSADVPAVALDGRMLPHEWLRDGDGAHATLLKCDGTDHHDDHFYPGPQDIAWDVAAACVEHELPLGARRMLVRRYRDLSGDHGIGARLPFHRIAYLAYRYGYATLAADTLVGTEDAPRWRAAARRYAVALERAVARGSHAA